MSMIRYLLRHDDDDDDDDGEEDDDEGDSTADRDIIACDSSKFLGEIFMKQFMIKDVQKK